MTKEMIKKTKRPDTGSKDSPMSSFLDECRKCYGFVERNLFLYKRFWRWELVWLFYNIVMALSIGFIGAGMEAVTGTGIDVAEITLYLLIGSVVYGFMATIFWKINHNILYERWEGTLEYTFMAPVKRLTHIIGLTICTLIYGVIRTAIIFVIAALMFDLSLVGANIPAAIVILTLSSISFAALGTMVSFFILMSQEKGEQVVMIVEAAILMVSGIYYPVTVLPVFLQKVSIISPARYTLEGMRMALLDGNGIGTMLWSHVLPLIIAAIVLVPLSLYIFGIGEKLAKINGRLKREG